MEVDISYLKVPEADVKAENDVKTEGEEVKTEGHNEGEGEKETTTLKTSNALVALVQVSSSNSALLPFGL